MERVDYWNHNVHYQPFIFRTIPPACGQALEVGCGDGTLAGLLAERGAEVTGRSPRGHRPGRGRVGHPRDGEPSEADFELV